MQGCGIILETIAIACSTLKDEIMYTVNELNINYPIIWIESGLHNTPEKLKKGIQEQINNITGYKNILLLFGSCGNALYGLCSENSYIIFPKVDDCISLFLGGNEKKKEWDKKGVSYYLTKGYLESESNIWTDYKHCVEKYGCQKAKKIMGIMLKNYEKLRIIETGAYNLQEILETTKHIASTLELSHEVISGTLNILRKALKGDWDQDFSIVNPGEPIGYGHLGII